MLSSIPYGACYTYKKIAEEVDSPKSFRSVCAAFRRRQILLDTNINDNYKSQIVFKSTSKLGCFFLYIRNLHEIKNSEIIKTNQKTHTK